MKETTKYINLSLEKKEVRIAGREGKHKEMISKVVEAGWVENIKKKNKETSNKETKLNKVV